MIRYYGKISRIIKQFKGSVSKKAGYGIWQKSFHEYQKIWKYIDENPVKWAEDEYFSR
jgi:hypothetical protein